MAFEFFGSATKNAYEDYLVTFFTGLVDNGDKAVVTSKQENNISILVLLRLRGRNLDPFYDLHIRRLLFFVIDIDPQQVVGDRI